MQDTYVERGVTGTRASRPEWDRLMQAARDGQIDVVVVTKWNRFARSAQVGLTLANELEQLHVDLVVIEAEFDTSTSQGRLFRHMMVGLAEFDRDMVIENMTMGARRAAQDRAVWPCSMTPYGYKHSGSGTEAQLTVDAEQQRVIEPATGWLVDDGLTTGQVCRRLDDLGMHPPRGGAWTHQNLRRKLTNRSLLGEHVWGRHPDDRHVDRGRHRPGKYGAPITVRSEPILSPERFAALQVALRRRSSGAKAAAQPYPLSGRLFCTCGEPYTGAHRADRNLRQYRCRGTRWTGTDERTCRSRRLTADWVEDTVWTGVVALLTDPERLRACAADYLRSSAIAEQKDEGPGDTAALDATIAN